MQFFSFINLDLLTVGVTIAAIAILGFIILFSDRKNATNKSFFLFSLVTIFYGVVNYLNYKLPTEELVLWALRFVIFFAVWHAYSLLQLIYVFPSKEINFTRSYKLILLPIVIITSILTLTPFVFINLINYSNKGEVAIVNKGPGILLFVLVVLGLVIYSIFLLIKKLHNSSGEVRKQLQLMLAGIAITFSLIIIFNVVLPLGFVNVRYVPLAPVFIFPLIIFTVYSILKHKLFNIKVAGVALLAFVLSIVTFIEIIFSTSLEQIIFRSSIFALVLIFCILLLKGVLREVEQREEIQMLAGDLGRVNDKLEYANRRLKDLDQMKTEFISLATHQIRAPLTAIKGYISLITEGDYGPVSKEVTQALDIVQQSANNLVTIVADFLDVSRIEQGKMKYDFKSFNLQELVKRVVDEYRPNIEKRGLSINYTPQLEQDYTIFADEGKIKQVVGNVIDNSIKYTPKGHIDVVVSREGDRFKISTSDTGVGIDPQTLPKLFQKFTRAANANEANILGTGLGLYVARQMIEAHKGKIWAESEGEHKGSKFFIELPLKAEIPQNAA